jgi:signal transduction histidine kinase
MINITASDHEFTRREEAPLIADAYEISDDFQEFSQTNANPSPVEAGGNEILTIVTTTDKIYIALCFAMLALYPFIANSNWHSSSDVHALLEFSSSFLAVTASVMVLLHFFTSGRWFFLFISIGFGQIGAEEFVHAIFSFDRIWPVVFPSIKLAISTTWLAGRAILCSSLFIAYFFGEKIAPPEKRLAAAIFYNAAGFLFSAIVAFLIFSAPHLSAFVRLGSASKELCELSLAALFFIAFLLYLRLYIRQKSKSPLLMSIIGCIILQVVLHIFMFASQGFFDAHWDAAHVIKLVGYFFPIFGVWGETMKIHERAQLQFNALEKEMTERKQTEQALALYRVHLEDLVKDRTEVIEKTLSDLRRTQEQLVQSEKLSALGSMVAGVSHELNTPIGNTKMAISTLIDRITELKASFLGSTLKKQQITDFFEESLEITDLAQRSIERAIDLVGAFKQVAVDQTSEKRRSFDLATVVEETIATLRPGYKKDPWQFVLDIPAGITMDSYPGPLEQIVMNLTHNSVRHGFDGRDQGCVKICAQLDAAPHEGVKQIILTVCDDGCGIPQENLGRVFDPFFTTKLGQGGSGIGLNITHRIVTTILGGTIRVDSPDRLGTIFTLHIPQRAPDLI